MGSNPILTANEVRMSGCTVWLTGLSGSGKTTIAEELVERLKRMGHHVYHLDGDVLRRGLNSNLGFSKKDRDENIRRAAEVAALFSDAGVITICSFISPYESNRAEARAIHHRMRAKFYEVSVDCPLDVCENRDPKGLYQKARSGAIKNFTGIDDPYENPFNQDWTLATNIFTVYECVETCVSALQQRKII